MALTLTPNIPDPDGFYDDLLAAHKGLEDAETHAMNARLVLLLANHIGDRDVLRQALEVARGNDDKRTAESVRQEDEDPSRPEGGGG